VKLAPNEDLETKCMLNDTYEFLPGLHDYCAEYTAIHPYIDHTGYIELVSNKAFFKFGQ